MILAVPILLMAHLSDKAQFSGLVILGIFCTRCVEVLFFTLSYDPLSLISKSLQYIFSLSFIAIGHFVAMTYLNDFDYFTKVDCSLKHYGYFMAFEMLAWDLIIGPLISVGWQRYLFKQNEQ